MTEKDQLEELLKKFFEFQEMAAKTESLRCEVDDLFKKDIYKAFDLMIKIDNNMLDLSTYYAKILTLFLKITD